MANKEHLKVLAEGVRGWNSWRKLNPRVKPDLSDLDFRTQDMKFLTALRISAEEFTKELVSIHLQWANLKDADLHGANLSSADLRGADLSGANLTNAVLQGALYSEDTIWPTDFDPIQYGAIVTAADTEESNEFTITFSEELTPDQIYATLTAMADYYRACGGVGFSIDFELEEALVREPSYA